MRSLQYHPAPDRMARVLRESAIVGRAIARHGREANSRGRTLEAGKMEALGLGITRCYATTTDADLTVNGFNQSEGNTTPSRRSPSRRPPSTALREEMLLCQPKIG